MSVASSSDPSNYRQTRSVLSLMARSLGITRSQKFVSNQCLLRTNGAYGSQCRNPLHHSLALDNGIGKVDPEHMRAGHVDRCTHSRSPKVHEWTIRSHPTWCFYYWCQQQDRSAVARADVVNFMPVSSYKTIASNERYLGLWHCLQSCATRLSYVVHFSVSLVVYFSQRKK